MTDSSATAVTSDRADRSDPSDRYDRRVSTRRLPRSRGVASGVLLILLGAWGGIIPFVGPLFGFSFTPDIAWHWTAARGWLEVLPGAAAVLAGLLLLVSASRAVTLAAAWLGVAAGAWFVIGPQVAGLLHTGSPGVPTGTSLGMQVLERLAFFTALGCVILLVAATALGRLSVVSLRDHRAALARAERDDAMVRDEQAGWPGALYAENEERYGNTTPTAATTTTTAPAPMATPTGRHEERYGEPDDTTRTVAPASGRDDTTVLPTSGGGPRNRPANYPPGDYPTEQYPPQRFSGDEQPTEQYRTSQFEREPELDTERTTEQPPYRRG